jgi:1,6-anhydro-N-acetylmuramate kinase
VGNFRVADVAAGGQGAPLAQPSTGCCCVPRHS